MIQILIAALLVLATQAQTEGGLKCGTETPKPLVNVPLERSMKHASKVFNIDRRRLTDERRTDTYFESTVTIPIWFHALGMETDLCTQCSEDPESCRGNYLEHFMNLDAAEGEVAHLNEAYEPTGLQFSFGGYELTCNEGYFRFGCASGHQTTSDRMKEALHQDTTQYVNLYYVDCQTWGLFGFATFPPGLEGKQEGHAGDGVINGWRTTAGGDICGDAPCEGDTAVHELGHFFGLYHTFEGGCEGGDLISDTPFVAEANYGCPTDGLDSCPDQGGGDHYWNFMDYADDHCMSSFSNEQGWRILWACAVYRPQLVSHALADNTDEMSCLQGTYMNYDVGICQACEEGTYYGGPDEGCVACPEDSTSNTIGNLESSDCYDTTTSCAAHSDCADGEYCSSSGVCYINSECCHYDDAIDSVCPTPCCSDTDDGLFNGYDEPCVAYTSSKCGEYETREFQAAVLCCVCGGGTDYVATSYTEDEMTTCGWRCGLYVNAEGCQCDDTCEENGDCCLDYDECNAETSSSDEGSIGGEEEEENSTEDSSWEDTTTVDPYDYWTPDYEEQTSEEQLSCLNDCGKYLKSWPCQCDPHCATAGDCCDDYNEVCVAEDENTDDDSADDSETCSYDQKCWAALEPEWYGRISLVGDDAENEHVVSYLDAQCTDPGMEVGDACIDPEAPSGSVYFCREDNKCGYCLNFDCCDNDAFLYWSLIELYGPQFNNDWDATKAYLKSANLNTCAGTMDVVGPQFGGPSVLCNMDWDTVTLGVSQGTKDGEGLGNVPFSTICGATCADYCQVIETPWYLEVAETTSIETTMASYDCGATMEECNDAYNDAMSVSCEPTAEPTMGTSLYVPTGSMLTQNDITDPLSSWMFNQQNNNGDVQAAFGLNDGMTLGTVANQYVVSDASGRVYETCVQHGAAGDACDSNLVCWTGASAGSASEQRSALLAAAERNNFQSADCPTNDQCTALSGYYLDMFTDRGIDAEVHANLCVSNEDALMYVTRDAYKHVCVGFGGGSDECPSSMNEFYLCAGVNDGLQSFGWPGQFVNAVARANDNAMAGGNWDEDSFTHPQCRY